MDTTRRRAWCLVSLRPQGGHAPLRRVAARHGIGVLALSPWRLQPRTDAATRQVLDAALEADVVLFTSPAAVHAAAALRPLGPACAQRTCAGVGAGTAAALRRHGVAHPLAPQRMDSEGLLALPAFAAPAHVGLVTAPGGRGMIAAELARRGAALVRADVYARVAVAPSSRALAGLRALDVPACIALSSEEALRTVLARVPEDVAAILRRCRVAAASARLAAVAGELGFGAAALAASARPADLVDAARAAMHASD
jgi:uroporphyrinogen-III synthase